LSKLAHEVEEVSIVCKVCDLLLEVINRAIQVARTVDQHVEPLIAAGLIVQDYDDQVAVDFTTFGGDVFQHLFPASQSFQRAVCLFVLELNDCF